MAISIESLALPEHLSIESGPGGLPCLRLQGQGSRATMLLHGAHITEFVPEHGDPVLWMSARSQFEAGLPVRGGIPVCWPWFGPHPADKALPVHGAARLRAWTPLSSQLLADGRVEVRLAFTPGLAEKDAVPAGLRAELTVRVGRALKIDLETINDGPGELDCEAALHAYFALSQAQAATVNGLEGAEYLDKLDGQAGKTHSGPIRFEAETERVYRDKNGVVQLVDEQSGRTLRLEQSGAANRVVWNPWITKSAAMPDFGDDEWTGMCCVETANCLDDRIHLAPGARHSMTLRVSVA